MDICGNGYKCEKETINSEIVDDCTSSSAKDQPAINTMPDLTSPPEIESMSNEDNELKIAQTAACAIKFPAIEQNISKNEASAEDQPTMNVQPELWSGAEIISMSNKNKNMKKSRITACTIKFPAIQQNMQKKFKNEAAINKYSEEYIAFENDHSQYQYEKMKQKSVEEDASSRIQCESASSIANVGLEVNVQEVSFLTDTNHVVIDKVFKRPFQIECNRSNNDHLNAVTRIDSFDSRTPNLIGDNGEPQAVFRRLDTFNEFRPSIPSVYRSVGLRRTCSRGKKAR